MLAVVWVLPHLQQCQYYGACVCITLLATGYAYGIGNRITHRSSGKDIDITVSVARGLQHQEEHWHDYSVGRHVGIAVVAMTILSLGYAMGVKVMDTNMAVK